MKAPRRTTPADPQRGMALIIVMVVLLLACTAVLSNMRQSWLNERMVGSEVDQQRAFVAAEALLRDAERDIRGLQPDGTPCQDRAGFVGCRNFGAGHPYFPQELGDLDRLQERVRNTGGCLHGICLSSSPEDFGSRHWDTALDAMTAAVGDRSVAARYGEFTGVQPAPAGNPLLHWIGMGEAPTATRGWYWVEVFLYDVAAGIASPSSRALTPDTTHPFVYRITAYVQGMRPGTRVWLRSIYVPRPQAALE